MRDAVVVEAPPVVSFLGGTGTVTGSKFLVEVGDTRLLVDAGLFQGIKQLRLENRERFPIDPASLDAVILTHAHLDHTGYLPALVRAGFEGPAYATLSTAALTEIVLEDSARLQEEEADYANRKRFSKHRPALPLYTQEDARRAVDQLRDVPFDRDIEVAPDVRARFQRAGHILGSASVVLTLPHGERLVVSGDLGRPTHPILRPPESCPEADVVIVESTYGDRRHESAETALARFADVVTGTARRGGTVVIPAFAVDRTEVVIHALWELARESAIPDLPVYVDSPMALSVLDVYRDAFERHDGELRDPEGDDDAFAAGELHETRTTEESKALNRLRYPSIIISSSGMATGGRVLHHLAQRLGDPRNSVVLVGFQAQGTRGRLLADGARSVKLLGHYVPVRADIELIDAFSVHADADELVAWLEAAPAPSQAFVVHGEPAASAALCDRLGVELGWPAVVPSLGERVRVDA